MYENLHSSIQHEFGHALGIANGAWKGRSLIGPYSGTNPEAIQTENKAREWYMYQASRQFGMGSPAGKAATVIWADRGYHD
jgi:predicted Zn-dependent protease